MRRGIVLALFAFSSPAYAQFAALPKEAPAPADNAVTPEKVALGKALYFDPRLSVDNSISCASCHEPRKGGADVRSGGVSLGVKGQKGGRNSPTVLNAAFHSVQFWDGRAASLEEQAKGPIANPVEMGMSSADAAAEKLKRIPGYAPLFEAAFGKGEVITADNLARAIASYERTLITADSAYDRFQRGDPRAMSAQARRGMETFAKVGCTTCHMGPNFDGPTMPAGTGFYMAFPTYSDSPYVAQYHLADDLGRYEVTKSNPDKHQWRVPTLRNVVYTAPYFHNGSVKALDEAVRVMASVQLDKKLSQGQVKDLVAFLTAISGPLPDERAPVLPPSAGEGRLPPPAGRP